MTNKLYAWCEIDDVIEERNPEDLFRCNAEGGWVTKGWVEGDTAYGKSVVEIRANGRHYALETWAESIEAAHVLFMHSPIYAELQK